MPLGVRKQLEGIWEAHGLEGRTLLVRKARVVKLEAIVRGYLTGTLFYLYILFESDSNFALVGDRLCMGGVQEDWYGTRDQAARGLRRVL